MPECKDLPDDILRIVLEYASRSFYDLIQYSHINSSWKSVIRSSRLWLTVDDSLRLPLQMRLVKLRRDPDQKQELIGTRRLDRNYFLNTKIGSFRRMLSKLSIESVDMEVNDLGRRSDFVYETFRSINRQMHQYYAWYVKWMPIIWKFDNILDGDGLLALGMFAYVLSIVFCAIITCFIFHAGPAQAYPYSSHYRYYWKLSVVLAYVSLIFDFGLGAAACIHFFLTRLVSQCEEFKVPWDTLWPPMLFTSFIGSLITLLFNFQQLYLNGISFILSEQIIRIVSPFIIIPFICTGILLLPASNFNQIDLSYQARHRLETQNGFKLVSVQQLAIWVYKATVDYQEGNITYYKETAAGALWWSYLSSRFGYHNPRQCPRHLTNDALLKRVIGIDLQYRHYQQLVDRRRDVFLAMVYAMLSTCILLPVVIMFQTKYQTAYNPLAFDTSLPLIIATLILSVSTAKSSILKIFALSVSRDFGHSHSPFSWLMGLSSLALLGSLGCIFFLVCIVLNYIGYLYFIRIPTCIGGILTCLHLFPLVGAASNRFDL